MLSLFQFLGLVLGFIYIYILMYFVYIYKYFRWVLYFMPLFIVICLNLRRWMFNQNHICSVGGDWFINYSRSIILRMKRRMLSVNVGSLLMCAYLFYRHNTYCEPFVFSVFAFFEYVFVLSNIAFHSTYRFDFSDRFLYISWVGTSTMYVTLW